MSNPDWEKKSTDEPFWEGPREAEEVDLSFLGDEDRTKVETILGAMVWPQLVVFRYGDSDRVVAPFVVGVSSSGNPLLRGFQLEGISRSGKVGGWRVFQISKMENLANYQEFFDADDFEFDRVYPWVYKVIRML